MDNFQIANEERVGALAAELNLSKWLVEALIVEYLPCRRFFERNAVVLFDFGLIEADDIRRLPRPLAILSNYTVFHNITREALAQRMISGLIGLPMVAAGQPSLILPEGKVNPVYVPWPQNPVSAWDWKLNPSNHAVVADTDGLYQWAVATFGNRPEPGATRGWFTSAVYGSDDLARLRVLHDEIVDHFLSPPHPEGPAAMAAARTRLATLYDEVEDVRARLRAAVVAHHAASKGRPEAVYGYTEEPPLTLTVFDQQAVVDGKLKVRSRVEPLLFRAAHRAAIRAESARTGAVSVGRVSVVQLAEEIEAAAEAITLSAMCLEAYINGLIVDLFPDLWKEMERMEAKAKWLLVPVLLRHRDCFARGTMPFQSFAKLIGWRNELVHYKHEFANPVEVAGLGRVSELHGICNVENARKAVDTVTLMVRRLHDCLGIPGPEWGKNAGGWLNPI
jgi:hypothetical protein